MAKASPASRDTWWKAIRTSELSPSARLLALTLSTWMRADGTRCYPGQDAIADACGWASDRAVRRAATELVDAGYITVHKYGGVRPDGRSQATHRYAPTIPNSLRPVGHQRPTETDDLPDPHVRENDGPTGTTRPTETTTSRTHTSGRNPTTSRTSEHDQSDISVVLPDAHVRQGNQLEEVPSLKGHPSAPETPDVNSHRVEGGNSEQLDNFLAEIPTRITKHITPRQRPALAAAVATGCALGRGRTPRQLAKAVLALDADLKPLDKLASRSAIAKALETRIKRLGPPPPRPDHRPPTPCADCGTTTGIALDRNGAASACPTCRPEGLGDTEPHIDRVDPDPIADLLEDRTDFRDAWQETKTHG